jgi:hypothetical protein
VCRGICVVIVAESYDTTPFARPAGVISGEAIPHPIGIPDQVISDAIFEFWYGGEKSQHKESNTNRLKTFLSGPVSVIPFEEEDAGTSGTIRAH